MASIKVIDPVSVPLSVFQELQELRAQLAPLRQENERLRQENERLRRELAEAKAGLDQAKGQSKRQAAPFSKGLPNTTALRVSRSLPIIDVIGKKEFVIFPTAACDSVLEGCAIHKPLPSPNRRLLLLCSARHLSQCG